MCSAIWTNFLSTVGVHVCNIGTIYSVMNVLGHVRTTQDAAAASCIVRLAALLKDWKGDQKDDLSDPRGVDQPLLSEHMIVPDVAYMLGFKRTQKDSALFMMAFLVGVTSFVCVRNRNCCPNHKLLLRLANPLLGIPSLNFMRSIKPQEMLTATTVPYHSPWQFCRITIARIPHYSSQLL